MDDYLQRKQSATQSIYLAIKVKGLRRHPLEREVNATRCRYQLSGWDIVRCLLHAVDVYERERKGLLEYPVETELLNVY